MGPVFTIANQKGGVGKTTTCINLAASLAALNKRVLIIDFDPQGNATSGLGVEKVKNQRGSYHVLINKVALADVVVETECEDLYLIPASMDLAGAEVELVGVDKREYVLNQAMAAYTGEPFDYVLIDCPPALNLLTINALTASDHLLITLQAEFYALEGLTQLIDTVRRIKTSLNPMLKMHGILLTMVGHNNLARQVEKEVRDYFGQQVYTNMIPRNIRLSEAPSFGVPVMYHDIHSSGAQAYLKVAQELMHRIDVG
ncbi:MAG: ParA family protein [Zetaproteobacteria bacterium]|nr:ParA family protein [Zetaproteobacteria bacterium]